MLYQFWIQSLLAILVLSGAVVAVRHKGKYDQAFVALVSQQGDWTYLSQQQKQAPYFQITAKSTLLYRFLDA